MMATLSKSTMTIAISFPRRCMKWLVGPILLFSLFVGMPVAGKAQGAPSVDSTGHGLKPILDYISTAWDTLTRSMTDCKSIVDPKITAQSVLYLPKEMAAPASVKTLVGNCNVRSQQLPEQIQKLGQISTSNIDPPGLLYLPNKYVVPGGRFNEMYGWTAISSFEASCAPDAWTWRGGWSTTFCLKSNITAPCSTPTGLIT